MIAGDAANFLLGGIPGDLHDMFTFDVEPVHLAKASRTFTMMSTSVRDIHVKLSGSVASLEGRWEGSGAVAFDAEIWQPLSCGLGTLERECETAAANLTELAEQAEAAQLQKVEALNQEIQTQLWIFGATSMIGAPELGGVIAEAVGGLAARLGGELVGRIVSGIVQTITTLVQKVVDALGRLLTLGLKPLTSLSQGLSGEVARVIERLRGGNDPQASEVPSASGSDAAAGFAKQSLREAHFDKHILGRGEFDGFGYQNATDYEDGAQRLVSNPNRMYFTRSNGNTIHFLEGTNEFAVTTPGNTIRTYFQPDERLNYFIRELMRG